MARRKEVFQSKVLQRLYPAAPEEDKGPSPPRIIETLAKKTCVKRKACQEHTGGEGKRQSAASLGRRLYTVLPPPADYKADPEKSITLPQLESEHNAEDPAEDSVHDSSEELDQDEEEKEQRRKRRRRKKKAAHHQEPGKDGASPVHESIAGQASVDEGGERLSRNKKRKLKKKRHKEKLLSMGLMPRATALEFTYQKDEEQEEDNERRAAEVSDFLRTTVEIYMSDSSSRVDKLPLLSGTVDDLLSSVANGCKPPSVLKQLFSLKAYVQQKETDKLEKALEELHTTSPMSPEETTAVISLFQYWITDILPMQGDKKTGLSTTHP